jgi:hypothetical protein
LDLGEPAGQAGALNELGLVQQLTGDYSAASASHQRALRLYRDLSSRDGLADVPNTLGELAHQTRPGSGPVITTARRWPSPASWARRWKKHVPWKESAAATSKTATPLAAPPPCGRR